jgi:hypothetical protein
MGQHSIPQTAALELFDPVSVIHGDRRVRAFKIACSKCNFSTNAPMGTMIADSGERESRLVRRKFEERGWHIGKNKTHHLCPACERKAIEDRRSGGAKPVTLKPVNGEANNMVGGHLAAVMPPAAVPEMTKEHRRIIFAKLNEVYVSETAGYANDWTDKKVAEELGCPRAWVETIRKENFGEKAGNDTIGPHLEEARRVVADGRKMLSEIGDLKQTVELATKRINELMSQTAPLVTLVVEVEGRMREIEKVIR